MKILQYPSNAKLAQVRFMEFGRHNKSRGIAIEAKTKQCLVWRPKSPVEKEK